MTDARRAPTGVLVLVVLAAGLGSALVGWAGQPAQEAAPAPAPAAQNEAVDKAIDRGLAYLARVQLPDGSFPSGLTGNTGIASLCVMAFLAKGYMPGEGEYGSVINKGIDYVLGSQLPNGLLVGAERTSGPMYGHCISTLMLSEVSGMVDPERQKKLDGVLATALKAILAAQQVPKAARYEGGWRYQPTSNDSDISLTGWPLMALRSARNNGGNVPKDAIEHGLEFVMRCRAADGGFAYQPGGAPGPARTGVALLCLELCGRHRDPAAIAAGDWVLAHLLRSVDEAYSYYALYYCAQGMYQLGDQYWERYSAYMYDMMLKLQRPDGSWPEGSSPKEGACYTTAMTILAMAVPYCQLPIYQR
jgi:hypothetical protein